MASKIITRIISLALIAVMLASGFMLEKKMNEYRTEQVKKTKVSMQVRSDKGVDFDKLRALNPDARAWIYLPGTPIDYPVVYCDDNDYYLHRDIEGNYLFEGTPFIDAGNEHPFHDKNTVIYGHNMFSGSMFTSLSKFEDEKFFKEHSRFQLTTAEGEFDIKAIAYLNEPADSDLYSTSFDEPGDAGEVYYEGEAPETYTTEDFIAQIKSNAKVLSDEPFSAADTFVTLSTCAYNYEDARHQVIGIICEPGLVEKTETTLVPIDRITRYKWLILQIALGILMAAIVLAPLIRMIKGRTKGLKK